MKDDELNDIRQLIDLMQSGLVELFDQLRELRERLNLVSELPSDLSPSILPLFSRVASISDSVDETPELVSEPTDVSDSPMESPLDEEREIPNDSDSVSDTQDSSSVNAKVNRVLDPIARELKTGEATADIILEYLQTAKEYLINDDDERKSKVSGDMDVVLNFLKARGNRGIRTEERDNILKRIRRWKAHLVSISSSPAE